MAGAGLAKAQSYNLLDYPTSARTLAMGGIGTAFPSDNAAATLDNPAQLGLFSLDGLFNANTGFHNPVGPTGFAATSWLDVNAFNIGTALNRICKSLPFKAGAGLGYSNITSSSSPIWLGGGPYILENNVVTSNAISVGLGLDYLIKLGLGFSFKWVAARYDFPVPASRTTGEDFGAIAHIPLSKLIAGTKEHMSSGHNGIEPLYGFTIGYAMRNLSGYNFGGGTLPTEADLGWSVNAGFRSQVAGHRWEWLSFSWSEQAGSAPFNTDSIIGSISQAPQGGPDTTWDYALRYQKGLGRFDPWQELVIGRASATAGVRKGGQIGLGEFLYIRAGSITDAGRITYSTFGLGLRLDGFLKCLVFLNDLDANAPVADFLLRHLDLQLDYGRAYGGIYQGRPFEDLNLVVR